LVFEKFCFNLSSKPIIGDINPLYPLNYFALVSKRKGRQVDHYFHISMLKQKHVFTCLAMVKDKSFPNLH